MTTYAENIGVMAATRVYSTLLFVVAAVVSILLGFSPKFGALILSIPGPVIGGLSLVLFGLIAAMAGRIGVENRVRSNPQNLIAVATALTAGAGDLSQVRRLYHGRYWHRDIRCDHPLSNLRLDQSQGIGFCARQRRGKRQRLAGSPLLTSRQTVVPSCLENLTLQFAGLGCGAVAIGPDHGSETVTSSR